MEAPFDYSDPRRHKWTTWSRVLGSSKGGGCLASMFDRDPNPEKCAGGWTEREGGGGGGEIGF